MILSSRTSIARMDFSQSPLSFLLPALDTGSEMTALGNRGQSDDRRNGGTETFEGDSVLMEGDKLIED